MVIYFSDFKGLPINSSIKSDGFLSRYNTSYTAWHIGISILYFLAKKYNIEMPICHAVYEVLYLDKKPSDLIDELMGRPLKSEK